MSVLSRPEFHNEEAAFAHLEKVVWGAQPVCPHCGGVDRITKVKANPEKRIRLGLWRCGQCKGQFTVKVGTVFEHARMPLHKMLQAVYLMVSSKKGVSAHQLHRTLEVTYKTAWFLAHRIREAMRSGELAPFGQGGGGVEVDETYIGFDPDHPVQEGQKVRWPHKNKMISLIDRNTGRARSYIVDKVDVKTVADILTANVSREVHLLTDQAWVYKAVGGQFASHHYVDHRSGEYVSRDNPVVHTQTVEGFYSIFKRGMRGVYQHASKKHLHRYAAEFDFRYTHRVATGVDDQGRARLALAGVVGKRLTYRSTNGRSAA